MNAVCMVVDQGVMKRREFIKVASLAGAISLATPHAVWGAGWGKVRLKKALKLHTIEGDYSTLERFALAKRLGFDGIELRSPSDLSRQEVLAARDETGLPIHGVIDSVHWYKPLSSPDPEVRAEGVEALRTALADARAYGASTVLLVPGVVTKQIGYDAAWQRSREGIRKALPAAEKHGVTIAIENVWNNFLLSPLETARYIDSFESPQVGAYFDIGNVVRYGWPHQWIKILGDRIVKLDVKGYSREKQNKEGPGAGFVEIGAGDIDWAAIREALADVGYAGWATAEVPGGGEERLREIGRHINQVLPVE